jgi:hypothetical protein
MLHWTPDLVVSITSAAIALVAASVSALFSYRGFRIQKLGARDQYFSGLISWAENAVDLTAEAVHVCDLDPRKLPPGEFFKRRHQLQFRLSATIEKGRWFFPNIDVDTHGIHKEEAYRGYRPMVLDSLVWAYRSVGALDYVDQSKNPQRRDELVKCQRLFTTEIQKLLDPRSRKTEFEKLMAKSQENRDGGLPPR